MTEVQEIDAERLMEQIRENIRRRKSVEETLTAANAISPSDNSDAAADFAYLHSLHDIQKISFTSHRRVLGSLVILVKRILLKLLTPILERQVAYNAASARAIETLDRRLHDILDRQLPEILALEPRLRQEILAAESHLRDVLVAQSRGILAAVSQLRQERLTTEARLREMLAAQSQEILAAHSQLREERLATESGLREVLAAQSQEILAAHSQPREEMLGAQLKLRDEVTAVQSRLHDELITQSRALAVVQQSSVAARERISAAERKLRRILHALQNGRPEDGHPNANVSDGEATVPLPELDPEFDYAGFEERFRGSEEDVKERQRIYLKYFDDRENILDIGCGRGEFLEVLREAGIKARGVDRDLDMVLLCRDKGLDVVMDDAFTYVGALPDDSLGGVFAAQVIEHLHPRRIIELVKLCYRKLVRGGVLILETPNPKCLMVFADSFYRDPSHLQPIHPDTMQFLFEATGFHEVEIVFSAPVHPAMRVPHLQAFGADLEQFNHGIDRLNALLFGLQDYAVLGRKGLVSASRA